MKPCTAPEQALAFIEEHGIVLVSAKGPAPRMTDAIAGEAVKGSWWGHPAGRQIFSILDAVTESEQVLVCRLVDGKLTLVHRRLWPLLASLADRFAPERIARVTQQHTSSERHINTEIPYPDWLPAGAATQASTADRAAAEAIFGRWLTR